MNNCFIIFVLDIIAEFQKLKFLNANFTTPNWTAIMKTQHLAVFKVAGLTSLYVSHLMKWFLKAFVFDDS